MGRLPSRGPAPLPNYIPFLTEKVFFTPFYMLSIEKLYPFHIASRIKREDFYFLHRV